jgi:hypothetical protein
MHWPTLKHVEQFIGDKDSGAFHLPGECDYRKLYDVWPPEISAAINAGELHHPVPPYYFRPDDEA